MKRNVNAAATGRTAGILMHISSLPGPYGIGDLGKPAKSFADFLHRTGQSHWQLLPLNPTSKATGHSPYSSISAFAGNTLLISPDLLVESGLLQKSDLQKKTTSLSGKVNYDEAEVNKRVILEKAYLRFCSESSRKDKERFRSFCKREKLWLDDFALFVSLKKRFNDKPWYQWPESFRDRRKNAIEQFEARHQREIEKVKWEQFTFDNQWKELKAYCNERDINIFGDLPFYVSHDSADVWANRNIFSVDKKGKMKFVAGVPPDYFNSDGQLWGMPVFRWDILKRSGFDWWVNRLKKNIELFDLVRLDHFRAFADYWAVPGKETTAKNGSWKKGPGAAFFKVVARKIGNLPFVAEDLGDIDEHVHSLRLEFNFPGMKILQFGFGGDFPQSPYLPHQYEPNFVCYTGTHDNNTTRGWFRQDTGKQEKINLRKYLGDEVVEQDIANTLTRLAFSSIASMAIIPIQDLLGLDEKGRMNSPATAQGNWLWRMTAGALTKKKELWLKDLTATYARSTGVS